jgi:thiosulfate reductase cytochrome b subunit
VASSFNVLSDPATRARALKTAVVGIVGLAVLVLLARWARGLEPVASFVERFPGAATLPASAPVGFPAWLAWQHVLNAFLLLLLVRTGWRIRTITRPKGHWQRSRTSPRISLDLWLHLAVDALWILNGAVFYVLLFATGQWVRVVPTSWDVVPNALSAALQYASLDWPLENGWVAYNGLQLLTYFVTVFVAAPLAVLSGLRLSAFWPGSAALSRRFTVGTARAIHVPVMVYFVLFTIVHVTLVLATGALRNLNHMFAVNDGDGWVGFILFAVSVVVMVGGWFAAHPVIVGMLARTTGKVTR